MKSREYKNAVDNIRCSESFIKEMEEKLSSPISETHEYADSISEVERVKPRSISRIIGTAAACAVVCVGIGLGVNAVKNAEYHTMPSYSAVDNSSSSTSGKYENLPSLIQDFTDLEWGARYDEGERIILTYEQKAAVAELLNTISWDTDIAVETADTPDNPIVLNVLNSDLHYSPRFYDNGYIRVYSSIGDDGVEGRDDNYWSVEKYQQLYDIIFGAEEETIEGTTEKETIEPQSELSDTEFVCTLLDEQLSDWEFESEYTEGRFMSNAGQYSDWISFMYSHDDLNNIKNILKSCEWKQLDDSADLAEMYENFYVMRVTLNECGYIQIDTETSNNYFKTDDEEYMEAVEYVRNLKNDKLEHIRRSLSSFRKFKVDHYGYAAFSADAYIKCFKDVRCNADDDSEYTVNFSSAEENVPNARVYYDYDKDESYIKFNGVSTSEKYDNKVYNVCSEWLKKDDRTLYVETYEENSDITNYENSMNTLPNEINTVVYGNKPDEIPFDYFGLYTFIPQFIYDLQAKIEENGYNPDDYCTFEQDEYDEKGEYIGIQNVYSIFSESVKVNPVPEWRINLILDYNGDILMYERYYNGELVESVELSNISYEYNESDFDFPEYPEIYDTLINK